MIFGKGSHPTVSTNLIEPGSSSPASSSTARGVIDQEVRFLNFKLKMKPEFGINASCRVYLSLKLSLFTGSYYRFNLEGVRQAASALRLQTFMIEIQS